MSLTLTTGLARFVASPGFAAVPATVATLLRSAFIDTLACLASGRDAAVTQAALALASARSQAGSAAGASVLLGNLRLHAADAAFVNAAAAHALDYDDMALNGHPSVVLVPALLAAGQAWGADNRTLLRAYLVGYEVWAALAAREPDSLHTKGWHPTSVLGTVGAAAAVAHLLGLDATQAGHALGIAASMASGLMGNFGSMTKPLHAGWAAGHAIEAVCLARAGATAHAQIFESPTGFLAAFSPAGRADRGPWVDAADLRIHHNGLSIKKYPVCYAAHRVIDGVIGLRAAHGFAAAEVAQLVATVSTTTARVLQEHAPRTALQAKFSLEFACAMAACDGAVGLPQVTDANVLRADVQALMGKVGCETVAPGCPFEPDFALHDQVRITLADGRVLDSGPIRFPRGHAKLPLTEADVQAKFMGCVGPAEQAAAASLLAQLLQLDGDGDVALCRWLDGYCLSA